MTISGFAYSGIVVHWGTRITIADSSAIDPVSPRAGGYQYNFNLQPGQQVLFTNLYARKGRHHYVSNGKSTTSGIVFHRSISDHSVDKLGAVNEGHMMWTMAMLFDNITHQNAYGSSSVVLTIMDRGYNEGNGAPGSGHGWSTINSVAWNYNTGAGMAFIEKPPTAQNYVIGGKGKFVANGMPIGFVEGVNRTDKLNPESLYEAQLKDRLGITQLYK